MTTELAGYGLAALTGAMLWALLQQASIGWHNRAKASRARAIARTERLTAWLESVDPTRAKAKQMRDRPPTLALTPMPAPAELTFDDLRALTPRPFVQAARLPAAEARYDKLKITAGDLRRGLEQAAARNTGGRHRAGAA
jgi:hypothetical protein